MDLEELIQLQVLKRKATATGRGAILESLIESGEVEADGSVPLRQMCAKVSAQMYEELENVCGALDLTKREFIEAAVYSAIQLAKEHVEKAGGVRALFGADDQGRL